MHLKTSDQEKMVLGTGDYTCNWGTHICGLYETAQERDEIMYCEHIRSPLAEG